MKVLSLFDGMSCGQIALNELGIIPEMYLAAEIKPHAIKVTQTRYYRCKDYIKDKEIEEWERLNVNATTAEKNTQQTHEI